MALIRKNSSLIGFEQGVSVKSFDKLFQQTRARFFPLASPKLSFFRKDNSNASVILPINKIPSDPGSGRYNLQIEDSDGQTLKIRASERIKATSSLSVTSASGWNNTMSFKLTDNTKSVTFTCDTGLAADQNLGQRVSLGNYKFPEQGVGTSTSAMAARIFNVIKLAFESEELNILPTYTPGESVIHLEQTTPGEAGNTDIVLTNVTGKLEAANSNKFVDGTLGIPRTENGNFLEKTSRRYHRKDNTAHALYTRGAETEKQIASDICKIINNSGFKLKSKIIQDNVLLVYQETKGISGQKYGARSTPGTQVKQLDLNDQLETYNFTFSNKALSGIDIGEDIFYDVSCYDNRKNNIKRYLDVECGTFDRIDYGNLVSNAFQIAVLGEPKIIAKKIPGGWLRFENINLNELNPGVKNVEILSVFLDYEVPRRIIESSDPDSLLKSPLSVKITVGIGHLQGVPYSLSKIYPEEQNNVLNIALILNVKPNSSNINPMILNVPEVSNVVKINSVINNMKLGVRALNKLGYIGIEFIENPGMSIEESSSFVFRFLEKERLSNCEISFKGRNFNPRQVNQIVDTVKEVNVVRYLTGSAANTEGYSLKSTKITSGRGETPNYEVLNLESFVSFPPLVPENRPKASLTINTTTNSNWNSLSGLVLSGSNKSVDFKILITDSPTATPSRIDANNYSFPVKNIEISGNSGDKLNIISSIKKSIELAQFNNDLDISIHSTNLSRGGSQDLDALIRTNDPNFRDTLKLIQNGYFGDPKIKVKMTKSLTVNGTGYDNNSYIIVGDGIREISFYAKTSISTPERVSSSRYNFGTSGASTTSIIAARLRNAIQTAVSNKELDLVIPEPSGATINYYHLSRGNSFSNDKSILKVSGSAQDNNLGTAFNHEPFLFSDFLNSNTREGIFINFKEEGEFFVYQKPNYDLEIRSFGLGDNIDQFSAFHDISFLSGSLTGSVTNVDVSPVEYLKSINGEFPYKLINANAEPGFELDGALEPFPIRAELLGLNSDRKFYGAKGALLGSYDYNKVRNHSVKISSEINFDDKKQIPFFDQNNSFSREISYVQTPEDTPSFSTQTLPGMLSNMGNFLNAVYGIERPGIILIDNRSIDPFIDTEERILQAIPLVSNNPGGKVDELVSEVFALNPVDDDNLGVENFRREAGFTFGNSNHPGADSIVFGGLKYV